VRTARNLAFAISLLLLVSCSSEEIKKYIDTIDKERPLTSTEVIHGLKEALNVGTINATAALSKANGYLSNKFIKIPFPPKARTVENTLRKVGLGSLVGKVVTSLNRAAEKAAPRAKSIFFGAIKKMTFKDAMQILRGKDNEATLYFQRTTSTQLRKAFRPDIQRSLDKVNATRYWADVMGAYNDVPFTSNVNPDLAGYVTQKALEGLFYTVAEEERKIRKDPIARVTSILKRVFGHQDN